ncbi:MAG TPA: permease-like cell division protein FtsX [Solirubrobacteraceae bacterium]
MGLAFFVRESLRSIQRNAIPSFAAMASVLVTLLVLGVFIPVVQATTGAANEVRSKVLLDVYLKTDAKPDDVTRVRALLGRTDHVRKVDFVSKAQAYAHERKRNPEAYALLGSNPLPDTFRVTPDRPENIGRIRDALSPDTPSGGRTVVDPSIDEVKNRKDDTDKILSATRVVKVMTGVLAALLILASVLLVSNTIRLSLFARRREVEVMKLVGATDWFIRWPFVLEGVFLGALGGILAVLLLAVGKIALLDPLERDFALLSAPQTVSFAVLGLVLMLAAIGVSAAGSGLSLRRFLRV